MFESKVKVEVIRSIIDVTNSLVNEAKFDINKDRISLRAVDPAHVAMVELTLGKDAFQRYDADECELGVDLDKLGSIMKLAGGNDLVSIKHDTENSNLVIKIGNLTRRMALIDTEGMSDTKVPNLDLPVQVVLKASELTTGVRASESISDHLAITADSDTFSLTAEGDTDTVDLKLGKDNLESITANGTYRSMFSIDYFHNMIKPVKPSELITLHLGNDNPVKVSFHIADGQGNVTYLLAPRIETD